MKKKKKLEKKKRSSNKAVEKNQEVEKEQESEKKRKRERFLKIIFAIGGGIISILGVLVPVIEFCRNEQILKPRFSIERNIEEDGSLIWKIYNAWEAISNPKIYPTIHVTFFLYDEEKEESIDISLEFPDYYVENDYQYSNTDGMFYVTDKKQSELDSFIEKYENLFNLDEIGYIGNSITPYFTLNYEDYKGKKYNQIYTLSDDNFIDANSERNIYEDEFSQLKEISKVPVPDIIVPLIFEDECVLSINYKNAISQQVIETEQDYNDYLYSVILDLFNSKDKPIEEMYGMSIISNGNLWMRDMDTGELVWITDDVEDIGFLE